MAISKITIQFDRFPYVLAAILAVCTLYSILTHPLLELFEYSFYVAIPFAALIYFILVVTWLATGFKMITKVDLIIVVALAGISIILGFVYYCVWVLLKDTYFWILTPGTSPIKAVFIVVIFTLGSGILLFYFRLRCRSIYGIHEALVGLMIAAHRSISEISTADKTGFYLALLTACVYLVVRGLDNIHQGLIKDPIDPIGAKLFKQIKAALEKTTNEIKVFGKKD